MNCSDKKLIAGSQLNIYMHIYKYDNFRDKEVSDDKDRPYSN